MKTISSIKLTDAQWRQIIDPADGPTNGDKAVMMSVAVFFVWLLADMIGGWL